MRGLRKGPFRPFSFFGLLVCHYRCSRCANICGSRVRLSGNRRYCARCRVMRAIARMSRDSVAVATVVVTPRCRGVWTDHAMYQPHRRRAGPSSRLQQALKLRFLAVLVPNTCLAVSMGLEGTKLVNRRCQSARQRPRWRVRCAFRQTALRLARYFGTTPEFWIRLQAEYELREPRRTIANKIQREVSPQVG